MTADLTLEDAVALSLRRLLADAFPGVQVVSWDAPEEREKVHIGLRIDGNGEDPIGSGMYGVSVAIRAQNLDHRQRDLMRQLFGTAHAATETFRDAGRGAYTMPRGREAVESASVSHETENQTDRISTYELSAMLQPI